MDAMEALLTRRSRRTFLDRPVAMEVTEAIVRAGMFAPSASNKRNWEIMTLTNKEKLKAMSGMSRHWGPLAGAALAVVCCVDDSVYEESREEFGTQNGAAATENMLLAAHALGLGGVWLNNGLKRPHHEECKRFLGIPAHLHVVSVLAMGYPNGEPPVQPERFEPEKWHKETW